jgi:ABC-type polysaccharide/polyol phosphate transport system ATPase subunit
VAKLELHGVEVYYPVFTSGTQQSLLANVAHKASFGVLARSASEGMAVRALKGVSLSLKDGDRLGIVGRNGSGKTTLLKVAANLVWPQQGRVEMSGVIRNVIALGAGLDMEMTGFQNIDYVCRLYGLSKATTKSIANDIEEFSELGEFLNIPIRTYSSGMLLRLSFSLATALPGDILVVDEVLAAGDAHFIGRAKARIESLLDKARITVFATHSPDILTTFCNKAIWMDRGLVRFAGSPEETWARYMAEE